VVILIRADTVAADLEQSIHLGRVVAEAVNLARLLTNEPGNRINPLRFADKANEVARKSGLDIQVLDEQDMKHKGMNSVLAVAAGSVHPARFIVLKHLGAEESAEKPVVLIGKGVTFDSGGVSLKPAQSMEEMKADKAGACSVLAAMQAVAQLRVPRNVVALLPVVENLPGGKAQRPGDIIRSMGGKTIEVVNTDAEGRLILADALCYARAEFDPAGIVDLATLTGACVVALGRVRAGLFSNNDAWCGRLLQAANRCGEKLWRLPLDSEYRQNIESRIADVKNVGNRWGGAITAAKFLQEFVGETPWCHVDMAGVDLFHEKQDLEGPTGFGVLTLTQLVLNVSG
jgi:leucyl aminopeptidase